MQKATQGGAKNGDMYEEIIPRLRKTMLQMWLETVPLPDVENMKLMETVKSIEAILDELLVNNKLGDNTFEIVNKFKNYIKEFMKQVEEAREDMIDLAAHIRFHNDAKFRKDNYISVPYIAQKLIAGVDGHYEKEIDEHIVTEYSAAYWLAAVQADLLWLMTGKFKHDVEARRALKRIERATEDLRMKINYVYAKLYCIGARILTELDKNTADQIADELKNLAYQLGE